MQAVHVRAVARRVPTTTLTGRQQTGSGALAHADVTHQVGANEESHIERAQCGHLVETLLLLLGA